MPTKVRKPGTRDSKSRVRKAHPRQGRRLNALMIEDVDDDAVLTVRHLQSYGYDLHYRRVDTAKAMRAALDQETWDIILLDHSMPEFDGIAALKILNDYGLDVPAIVVTGTTSEEKAAEIMNAGARDLILKSNLSRLGPAIGRELEAAKLRWHKTQAEQLLRMQQNMLENLMANVPDSIYFKDTEHRYIHLNHAELALLNAASPEVVVGKPADAFLPPERARMREEEEKRLFATGEPLIDRVEQARQKDGTVRWYSATKAPIRDDHGKIMGLVGITRDVTRMKQAEEALRDSEAFFRAVVNHAPGAVVIKDLEGRNLAANKVFCSWYELTPEEIVGKTHDQFLDGEAAERVLAQERKVLETRTLVEEERRVTYPDGISRDVLVQKFPILDDNDEILALGTIVIDISNRKQVEVALTEKTRQLEVVLETIDQGIYAVDAELACTMMNRRYADLYELPPELSCAGVKFEELARFNARKGRYGPGDIEDHVKRRSEIARENRSLRYDFDLRNGRVVEIRSNPIPDGGFVRTITDITDLKQKENALRDGEERFRSILESLPTAVSLKDRNGRYIVVNKTLASWFGIKSEEIIGRTVSDFFSEREANEILSVDHEVFASGKIRVLETRRTFPDGSVRHITVHRCPIRSSTGEVIAISTIDTDITDIRKAETEIRKLSSVVEQSPASVIVTDTKGTIEYVNQAFTEITGYAAEEAIGETSYFLKSGDTPPETVEDMWSAIRAGKAWRGTFHNRKKDGAVYLAGTTIFPIADDDGRIIQFVATQQDITERANEQNRLKQAEKMESLGSLAGGVAHDFNNMLLPILALTKLTLRKLPDDSEHREKLEKVVQAATRAKDLVAQILAFSRQEELQQKNIDVVAVVNEILGLLRTTLPSTIKLDANLSLDGGRIFADAAQIGTVLLNLASNAADAMDGKPGTLKISLVRADIGKKRGATPVSLKSGSYAKIQIKDTGHGMDAATVKRIFEPFFTTKAVGKGTGLGLATAYGIITKHGGIIDVASQIDVGTTFDIYLPLVEENAEQ